MAKCPFSRFQVAGLFTVDYLGGMRAFIQFAGDLPTNVNTYAALRGFELLGAEIAPFTVEELKTSPERLNISASDVVCGYVGVVQHVFSLLGISLPHLESWPESLAHHLGRKTWTTTLGEVRGIETPVFLKPAFQDKAFQGHVRNVGAPDAFFTSQFEDAFQVHCSEVVEFSAEYRCFVLDGQPLDIKQYKGDFKAPKPDFKVVSDCIAKFAEAPRGYSLDLGVTHTGSTLLVEVNDGYSLGSYGLAPVAYANLLNARWEEIAAGAVANQN